MPKHKKTREQKRKADERRTPLSLPTPSFSSPTYSFSLSETQRIIKEKNTPPHQANQFILPDLRKTAIVSFGILFLQIIVYLLLRYHVLAFGLVRY